MKRLFIANRGEIAVRIIRTCREMGIRSVLGVSDADKISVAAGLADEVVALGPGPSSENYLSIPKILTAAEGCDAIHPGYGFLSERAEFAEACEQAGITFVGPSGAAMRKLGSKIAAKQLAQSLGVPLVPGYFDPDASDEQLAKAAADIGFPVMLKASAGGGGRGMRVVHEPSLVSGELATARAEALAAFGDGAMMVEKFIGRPRHIEAQILADGHENVELLFERECSLQRRHQKVLEESPSPYAGFRETMWPDMAEAVRKLCVGAGYQGAGTAEFIVDPHAGKFYFLEVNTRLQVEHPVTESVTGVDLVAWQLRIADGERLNLNLRPPVGHAIEVRILAEDPAGGFIPSTGKILAFAVPSGPGIRVDSGFTGGDEVTQFYDSLLAKLIVWGEDRAAALRRLRAALLDFHILGVRTNISFLLDLIDRPEVQSGDVDTGWIEREMSGWKSGDSGHEGLFELLQTAAVSSQSSRATERRETAWSVSDGFRNCRA